VKVSRVTRGALMGKSSLKRRADAQMGWKQPAVAGGREGRARQRSLAGLGVPKWRKQRRNCQHSQ